MAEYQAGCLVRSLAGHDKGCLFIILKEEAEYVYLADGKTRTAGKPKRKKKKHIQISHIRDQELSEALMGGGAVTDEQIRYVIRRCRKENPGR